MRRRTIAVESWAKWLILDLVLVGYTIWGFASGSFDKYSTAGLTFWILLIAVPAGLLLCTKPALSDVEPSTSADAAESKKASRPAPQAERATATKPARQKPRSKQGRNGPRGVSVSCPYCGNVVIQNVDSRQSSIAEHEAFLDDMVAGPAWEFSSAVRDKKGTYTIVCSKCGNAFNFR